jgi:outer membrane lipoprotein SlyB
VRRSQFLPSVALVLCSILSAGFPAIAQPQPRRNNNNNNFYNGANRGMHGGNYGGGHYNDRNRYQKPNQGGIGPGKGALIGGAAGAVLGAAFGGGVKGSLITGAAGAGVGAIIGQAAQNNRDNNNYYRR